jgi:hypothetical protein
LDTQTIIAELEAERDRLDAAISALQGNQRVQRGPGRPTSKPDGRKGKRHMSAAAKRKISERMKAAWAKRKKAAAA